MNKRLITYQPTNFKKLMPKRDPNAKNWARIYDEAGDKTADYPLCCLLSYNRKLKLLIY